MDLSYPIVIISRINEISKYERNKKIEVFRDFESNWNIEQLIKFVSNHYFYSNKEIRNTYIVFNLII